MSATSERAPLPLRRGELITAFATGACGLVWVLLLFTAVTQKAAPPMGRLSFYAYLAAVAILTVLVPLCSYLRVTRRHRTLGVVLFVAVVILIVLINIYAVSPNQFTSGTLSKALDRWLGIVGITTTVLALAAATLSAAPGALKPQ